MTRFGTLEIDPTPQAIGAVCATEPDASQRWMHEADSARRAGDYERALRCYSRALEIDRTIVAAWTGQVQMLVFLGEFPEADVWSRKALELFPGHGDLLAARAQALCRSDQLSQARELSDQSLAWEGESACRWMIRGEVLLATGHAPADHCFQRARAVDPDWLVLLEIALICPCYENPARAVPYLQLAVRGSGTEPYPWYLLGICQSEISWTDAARNSFEQCLRLNRNYADARLRLSELAAGRTPLLRRIRDFLMRESART
jgi:tetratricopeptide (TPR) repeat protein